MKVLCLILCLALVLSANDSRCDDGYAYVYYQREYGSKNYQYERVDIYDIIGGSLAFGLSTYSGDAQWGFYCFKADRLYRVRLSDSKGNGWEGGYFSLTYNSDPLFYGRLSSGYYTDGYFSVDSSDLHNPYETEGLDYTVYYIIGAVVAVFIVVIIIAKCCC